MPITILVLAGCARAEPITRCPARQIDPSPADAIALEERIAAIGRSGGATDVTISETEATAYLQHRLLADTDHTARLTFDQAGACLEADLAVQNRRVPAVLYASLSLQDGSLFARLETVSIGGRHLPALLRRSLESVLNELLAELGSSASVESMALRDGSLTLSIRLAAPP